MTDDHTDERGADYWRQRYYDSVEQRDLDEKAFHAADRILRRGLLRLAVAIEQDNAPLQSQLEALRAALRDNVPATRLEAQFESLSALLIQLEENKSGPAIIAKPWGALLVRLLSDLPVPADPAARKTLTGLQRKLEHVRESQDFQALLPALSQYLQATISAAAPKQSTAAAVVQSAATSPASVDASRADDHSAMTRAPPPSLLARLLTVRGRRHPDTGSSTGPAETPAHEVVAELLVKVHFPKPLRSVRDRMVTQLAQGMTPDGRAMMINGAADLIGQMFAALEEEKRDLERFLVQTTAHLGQMDQYVQGTEATRRASRQEGIRLQTAVQAQVNDISTTMDRVDDINQLKHAMRMHLDAVHGHLRSHRDTETRREGAAEEEVAALRARMKELEREVSTLRERIAQAHGEALRDPLTGIFNRQAYNERLAQEYARWKRYQVPLTLVVWDIDDFKRINDTHGHQAGDAVLRHVATLIGSALRETDFAARYGGEEFVALMPETSLDQAKEPSEKVRSIIASQPAHYGGRQITVTLSAGIAQFEEGDSPDHVFRRADVALYRAKMSGKNRVCTEPRVISQEAAVE